MLAPKIHLLRGGLRRKGKRIPAQTRLSQL
jgi:hypothetical protein